MKQILFVLLCCFCLAGCQGPDSGYSETQFLMDTVCRIESDKAEAVRGAFAKIREMQAATDRYQENSTVSIFNRAAAGERVALDPHTLAILETALAVSRASDGAFDVTVAPLIDLWDFGGEGEGQPPNRKEIEARLPLVNFNYLELDLENHTLTKTKDGVEIDLGGAAKGYAADAAAAVMKEAGASYGMLNLGGNVYVFGENPRRWDKNWQVGIQKPFDKAGTFSKTVTVKEGAVVTSGIYQRYREYAGQQYHHILDPVTGMPAKTGADGVTIVASAGLLADCLSTACLILGEDEGRALAKEFGADIYFSYREEEGGAR